MTNDKRRRGRPVGTHIRDEKHLALVADRMVSDPALKPSTAMRQVFAAGKNNASSEAAVVARWLRKWRSAGPPALEAARKRREWARRPTDTFVVQWPSSSALTAMEAQVKAIQEQIKKVGLPSQEYIDRMTAISAKFTLPNFDEIARLQESAREVIKRLEANFDRIEMPQFKRIC